MARNQFNQEMSRALDRKVLMNPDKLIVGLLLESEYEGEALLNRVLLFANIAKTGGKAGIAWLDKCARTARTYQIANNEWISNHISTKGHRVAKQWKELPKEPSRDVRLNEDSALEQAVYTEGEDDDHLHLEEMIVVDDADCVIPVVTCTSEEVSDHPDITNMIVVDEVGDVEDPPVGASVDEDPTSPPVDPSVEVRVEEEPTSPPRSPMDATLPISPVRAPSPMSSPKQRRSPRARQTRRRSPVVKRNVRQVPSPSRSPKRRRSPRRRSTNKPSDTRRYTQGSPRRDVHRSPVRVQPKQHGVKRVRPASRPAPQKRSRGDEPAPSTPASPERKQNSSPYMSRRVSRTSTAEMSVTIDRSSAQSSRPIVTVERKTKRALHSQCLVPNCTVRCTYPKAHAYALHLPDIFSEYLDPSDPQVLAGRHNALKQAATWMLGKPATMEDLMVHVEMQGILKLADNNVITGPQERAMRDMCNFLQLPVPDQFLLHPISSPAVLIHWKAGLLISARLEPTEQNYWRQTFGKPGPLALSVAKEAEVPVVKPACPDAFDSHFHLDRTRNRLRLPSRAGLKEIIAAGDVIEPRINIVGGVAVFCDPATYPTDSELDEIPSYLRVTVGIHPKSASRTQDKDLQDLRRLLHHPRICGLGEVGLDHSISWSLWAHQLDLLEKVLPLLGGNQVLVLHCRGMTGDDGVEAYLLLLSLLKRHVGRFQPMHLHCFTGNCYVLQRWIDSFSRTYFGFTRMVSSFSNEQVKALQEVDIERLLLETDAPYFPTPGSTVSTPGHLGKTAQIIAEKRGESMERILEASLSNARQLYGQ